MYNEEEAKSTYRSYDNDACMGKKAPALDGLEYITDAETYPTAQAGDVTVLVFWSQFSKSGYKFMPLYSDIQAEFKSVKVVGVSTDAAIKSPKKFLDDPAGKYSTVFPTKFAIAWDQGKALHAKFSGLLQQSFLVIHTFVVDANGVIVWHQDHSQIGATAPTFMTAMRTAIAATVAGEAVPSVGTKVIEDSDDSSEEEDEDGAGAMGEMF